MNVRFRKQAEVDLDDIWYFIAVDNSAAASQIIELVLARLSVLQPFPDAGRERNEIAPGLRSWPIASYVVYYRVVKRELQIVRILHGNQDPQGQIWDPAPK